MAKPSHHIFTVREGKDENDKGFWTKVGVAFAHKDGKGFNVILEAIPLDGKLTIRKADQDARS